MRDVSKLDRKRPYGTVTGDPVIAFVQDNRKYRIDGSLIEEGEPALQKAPEPRVPTPEELQVARNQIRSEKMKAIWAQRKGVHSFPDEEVE